MLFIDINLKKKSEKEVFQRKVNAILNLKSEELETYNDSNSKQTEITIKE